MSAKAEEQRFPKPHQTSAPYTAKTIGIWPKRIVTGSEIQKNADLSLVQLKLLPGQRKVFR